MKFTSKHHIFNRMFIFFFDLFFKACYIVAVFLLQSYNCSYLLFSYQNNAKGLLGCRFEPPPVYPVYYLYGMKSRSFLQCPSFQW